MHLVTFSSLSDLPEQYLLSISGPSGLQFSTAHPHITTMLNLSSLEVAQVSDPVGLKRFYLFKELLENQTQRQIGTYVYLSKPVAT